MKLARTTHFVIHTNDPNRGARNNRRLTRFATTRAFSIKRRRVIARWHICPETHRLECSWSAEPVASNDQLCRARRRQDQTHRRRRLMRPSTTENS